VVLDRQAAVDLLAMLGHAEDAMAEFPPAPVNDEAGRVFCPAFGRVIDDGLCWECCMAEHGGPTDGGG
jgi:hypothetical protein